MPKKKSDTPLKAVTPPRKKPQDELLQDADKAFLTLAHKRFKLASEADNESRKLELEDLKFSIPGGEQWTESIRNAREAEDAPVLTINRINGFVKLICNDMRSQNQSIQVNPVGSGADVKIAEIIQGYVRHVEVRSDADTIDDRCSEIMVRSGCSYSRVLTEYADETSLDQDLLIEEIRNRFSVYFDPEAKKADKSDANWCFIVEDLLVDEYKGQYPDTQLASLRDFASIGDTAPLWLSHDSLRVAEYFYVEKEPYELAEMPDGSVIPIEEVPKNKNQHTKPKRIVKRYRRAVKWARINAIETIEKKDWRGKYIPVVPDIADDFDIDGKHFQMGAVRVAKDAQRAYNFWITAASEKIALATKAPWLLASGQQEGFEKLWEHANTRKLSTLIWKPVKIGDQVLPPPREIETEPAIQGMVEMIRQADNDLKATFGIYDASLGQQGPQESGEAIVARQKQSDVAILNYSGNHARALRLRGKIILDLLPKVVVAPRLQRIINPDGSTSHVGIYNSQYDTEEQARERMLELGADQDAIKKIYDIGSGEYDVTISSGLSFQSRRQEAAVSMMKLVEIYPQLMQVAADLVVKNFDWPEAQALSDRLKKMMPPQIFPDTDEDPKQQNLKLQAQLNQMMQSHDLVVAELNKATDTIKSKRLEIDAGRESDLLKAQVALLTAQAKIMGEGALTALKAEIEHISADVEFVRQNILADKAAQDMKQAQGVQVAPPNQPKPDLSGALKPPNPPVPVVPVGQ